MPYIFNVYIEGMGWDGIEPLYRVVRNKMLCTSVVRTRVVLSSVVLHSTFYAWRVRAYLVHSM